MKHILIVDGSNLLFQMFYGMPSRIVNDRGQAIHGTLGFIGALLKIIRMMQPTHLAVLFDGECANPRKLMDADYKANRPDYSQIPEEETPFSQLPDIYAALDWLGVCHAETADCEADDWISGFALKYGREHRVTIISQDSDFFQLITDHVSVLRYRGDKSVLCDPDYIREKLGIEPVRYADFKAMTGDTADNIRGAEKIGPKTAASLLKQFGSLDAIISQADIISKPSIRGSILKNAPRLRMNYSLIHLNGSAQLPFDLDAMRFDYGGQTTMQILREIGLR